MPACSPCNQAWSLDEEYLAVVLAFISKNPKLSAGLDPNGAIDRALSSSPRLDERITTSLVADDTGRVGFVPENGRVFRIVVKVAYGLYCLRYGTGGTQSAFGFAGIWGPGEQPHAAIIAAQWHRPGIRRKRWTIVQKDIFGFMFAKGWMAEDPPLYCLIDLGGTLFAAVTCPAPVGTPTHRRLRSRPWA